LSAMPASREAKVSRADYRALAAFRYELRRFLAFSEEEARAAGIEPQQHQLLLALQGLPERARPTIGAVAERLCVQHHTAVALVDKLEGRGFVVRERSREDRREVLLRLTAEGARVLELLSARHKRHLRSVGPQMVAALSMVLSELAHPAARKRTNKSGVQPPAPGDPCFLPEPARS